MQAPTFLFTATVFNLVFVHFCFGRVLSRLKIMFGKADVDRRGILTSLYQRDPVACDNVTIGHCYALS